MVPAERHNSISVALAGALALVGRLLSLRCQPQTVDYYAVHLAVELNEHFMHGPRLWRQVG